MRFKARSRATATGTAPTPGWPAGPCRAGAPLGAPPPPARRVRRGQATASHGKISAPIRRTWKDWSRVHGSRWQTRAMPDAPQENPPASDLAALRRVWESMPAVEQSQSLVTLYTNYTTRFLSDNSRIWTTAASMIPLSLGAFVVLASIPHPSKIEILTLSTASWVLMSVWFVIAENHRAFQDSSDKVLRDIEQIWNFPARPSRTTRFHLVTGKGRIRAMRVVLWLAVTAGAVIVPLLWPGGY